MFAVPIWQLTHRDIIAHTLSHSCAWAHKHICPCTRTYKPHIHTHICVRTHTQTHLHTDTYTHTHTHTHTHTLTHSHTLTHTHSHTHSHRVKQRECKVLMGFHLSCSERWIKSDQSVFLINMGILFFADNRFKRPNQTMTWNRLRKKNDRKSLYNVVLLLVFFFSFHVFNSFSVVLYLFSENCNMLYF